MPAELVVLVVAARQPSVRVDLVGRDVDDGAWNACASNGFEQVHRAEDVRRVRLDGILVRPQDGGLCGHVEHDFRLGMLDGTAHALQVPDVRDRRTYDRAHFGALVQARLGRSFQRIPILSAPSTSSHRHGQHP